MNNYSAAGAGLGPIPTKKIDDNPDELPFEFRNKVKNRHRDSLFRDAAFVLGKLGSAESSGSLKVSGTSVMESLAASTLSLPLPTSTSTPSPTTTTISFLNSEKAARFWRQYDVPPELLPTRYRKPAPWDEITDPLRLIYLGNAIRRAGPSYSFSLNLSHDVELKARQQASPCDWLYRRITRRLEQLLGRPVHILIVLEDTHRRGSERRLHVHGVIGVSADEVAIARRALRLAGGEWEDTRQHQAHTQADPDDGWLTYIGKHHVGFRRVIRKLLKGSRLTPTFPGLWFAASKSVRRLARHQYEEADEWQNVRRSPKASELVRAPALGLTLDQMPTKSIHASSRAQRCKPTGIR